MTDHLAVHGITVSENPVITPLGAVRRVKVVRYMVGDNGPFQDEYSMEEFTPDKAKTGIEARVKDLRALLDAFKPL